MVKTKIVCTIGPASDSYTILLKMFKTGMDVARLNFSHGSHPEHLERVRLIRKINKKYRRKVKILLDLEGHRVRIGKLPEKGIAIIKNQEVLLSNKPAKSRKGIIQFDYEGSLNNIKPGHEIFIDDGNIALLVTAVTSVCVKTKVIVPGTIKTHKGINIPDADLKFDGLSYKDKQDIAFGIQNRVDMIAQSFVRGPRDIEPIRAILDKNKFNCKLIAKIENREGIDNISRIMDKVDGIMIARGDMGVSIPIFQVPIAQKEIIRKCNEQKKFVITATQMLESMTEHLIPERAEVSDVSNAVFDGTDMVMLSAETAAGKHPVEAVRMMNSILKYTENYIKSKHRLKTAD
jgi:pyruvate kinase